MSEIDDKLARLWRDLYQTPLGRQAISGLMMDLNLYSEVIPQNELQAGIALGERNVAARIARMIGRAPDAFVEDAVEDADILDRMITTRTGDVI
jgi:hypothetical protein